jgi:hypothetical protein
VSAFCGNELPVPTAAVFVSVVVVIITARLPLVRPVSVVAVGTSRAL